ncbi:hypothetical protein [uncultured Christiangramia sp.]|uniref:hypothetical protein n=1 Tax=uncultured Christiangramia sp. TaxID=503836 RepID=UPI002634E21D|nr:hypothetical protein [uncultured Christiangramia sp.]
MEYLETDELRFKTMKMFFNDLWFHSEDCSKPIEYMWFPIQETAKKTNNSISEIRKYLFYLIDLAIIKKISYEPLLFEFTDYGKKIKTDKDIKVIMSKQ